MKNTVLLIMIMVFTIQYSTAQEINIDTYPNEILGKWKALTYDDTLEDYVDSDYCYYFKSNNILELIGSDNSVLTLNYEISISFQLNNGEYNRFATLKIIYPDNLSNILNYDIYISIGEDSVKYLSLEAQGSSKNTIYKKIS